MRGRHLVVVGVGVLAVASVGCSSEDSGPAEAAAPACEEHSLSEFDGDCQRLEPPDPDDGFQAHYGPDDYDDPEQIAQFSLEAGGENTDCLFFKSPNTEDRYVSGYTSHIRPGGHHLIMYERDGSVPDGYGRCNTGADARFFVGANNPTLDGDVAGQLPEYEGAALRLGPNRQFAGELHMLNTSDEVVLREYWVNLYYTPRPEVKVLMDPIFFIGGRSMEIQPNTASLEGGTATAPADLTIIALTGHMHQFGRRFSVYKLNDTGEDELLYESTNWAEPGRMGFSDEVPMPATEEEAARMGETAWGRSGVLTVKRGDRIRWECDMFNTIDIPLTFGESAVSNEMCNLFGFYTPSFGDPWRSISMRPLEPR